MAAYRGCTSLLRGRFYHSTQANIWILIAALGNSLFARLPNCRVGAPIMHCQVLRNAILKSLCDPYQIMFFQLIRERLTRSAGALPQADRDAVLPPRCGAIQN